MGESRVGVLEVGYGNQPVVHPEVRNTVPHKQVHPAVLGADQVQNRSGDGKTEVTQKDELSILGLVQRARGVEVVDTAEVAVLLALAASLWLAFVVVVAGNVADKVHGPAEQLLQNNVDSSGNGGLLHQLVQVIDGLRDARGVHLTGLGNKNHITGDVTGGLVVLAVRDLP